MLAGLEFLHGLLVVGGSFYEVRAFLFLLSFELLDAGDCLTIGYQRFGSYKFFEFLVLDVVLAKLVDALGHELTHEVVFSGSHFGRVCTISLGDTVVDGLINKGNSQEGKLSEARFAVADISG